MRLPPVIFWWTVSSSYILLRFLLKSEVMGSRKEVRDILVQTVSLGLRK